jgi:transcription elongation factor GreA
MITNFTRYVSQSAYHVLNNRLQQYKKEYAELCIKLSELRELKDADEYDMTQENVRLAFLEKEIAILKDEVAHSKIMNAKPKSNLVQLGSVVYLLASDGITRLKCMVVSPIEADPLLGKISDKSPLGQALLGKMKDELIRVLGPRKDFSYRILDIQQA